MSTQTRVLRCNPAAISFDENEAPVFSDTETLPALQEARDILRGLKPVAFPTETVYGLGALALNAEAAATIFSTKGRPADNPLIVHVSSKAMLHRLLPPSYTLSPVYEVLVKRFWPGPLTLLFPTDSSIVPPLITAGQPSVALRMPSHPVARALIAVTDAPLAAPSANSSGKPSPTRAEHVAADLAGKIALVLDGGPCGVGLESTVVDGLHPDGALRVLRPGGVTVEDIERVLAEEMSALSVPRVLVHRRDYQDEAMEQAPTTPGMKYRHYSPAVPVVLLHTLAAPPTGIDAARPDVFFHSLKARFAHNGTLKVGLLTPSDSPILDHIPSLPGVEWAQYPLGPVADPSITAQRLFDSLLTAEREGVHVILIEEVAEEREGLAVMNRVKKAAGESVWLERTT
ncbi:L-threonylcarbamoyladenylate synthase [Phanerochaete sordida]|uniref:Threonylcarbamoyl-AMP synthase n=1 Tax=Phanerochaete sordida TaxID=48140 RepID=A0A9P3FXI3_9APHY|nr:L-threonylcarbamoyladenylate synthase [Phanerochaete sordida]